MLLTFIEVPVSSVCYVNRNQDHHDSDHDRPKANTLCFLVLCNRHWFKWVPGANLGIVRSLSTIHPYRDSEAARLRLCLPTPGLTLFSVCVCVLVVYLPLIFKDTEPSPLQDSFSVRQQGGLPGPPPRSP